MKIETQDWDYTCGDGCCYEYGTNLFIDGEQIDERFSCKSDALEGALIRLGFEVEEIYKDDDA